MPEESAQLPGKGLGNEVVPRAEQLAEFDEGWPQLFKRLTQAHRRVFVFFLMLAGIPEPIERRKLAVQRKALDDPVKTVAREYNEDLLVGARRPANASCKALNIAVPAFSRSRRHAAAG